MKNNSIGKFLDSRAAFFDSGCGIIRVASIGIWSAFCCVLMPCCVSASESAEEYRDKIIELVSERNAIKTLEAKGDLRRGREIHVAFSFLMNREGVRTDQSKIHHEGAPDQEGVVSRVAIVGTEKRTWHSIYGAELDFAEAGLLSQVELRFLGLTTFPAAMVPQVKDHDSTNVMARLARSANTLQIEDFVYEDVSCKRIFTVEDDVELSAFFDGERVYRGCSFIVGLNSNFTWVHSYARAGTLDFPVSVRTKISNGSVVVIDETIELESVSIDEEISSDRFELAALGVRNGDKVSVRNGSLGAGELGLVQGAFLDGKIAKLPDGGATVAIPKASGFQRISVAIGLLTCVFFVALVYRRLSSNRLTRQ